MDSDVCESLGVDGKSAYSFLLFRFPRPERTTISIVAENVHQSLESFRLCVCVSVSH